MRILPAALKYSEGLASDEMRDVDIIYNLSALTHAHTRSKLGCLIYSKIIADMVQITADKFTAVESSLLKCKKYLESVADKDIAYEMQKYLLL